MILNAALKISINKVMFFINDVLFVNNYNNRVVKDFSGLSIIIFSNFLYKGKKIIWNNWKFLYFNQQSCTIVLLYLNIIRYWFLKIYIINWN